jgi:hypothetical protein
MDGEPPPINPNMGIHLTPLKFFDS